MTEMKEADKVPFLDAPVSSGSLFGPAVEGFAKRFTEAQKSSQAMQRFLPKRTSSSAVSSSPKPVATQQPAKPTPTTPEPRPDKAWQGKGVAYQYKVLLFGLLRDAWMWLSPLCDRWEFTSWAHSGPVRGRFNIAQDPSPQPLMLPGAQGQLCQEHTVTQPTSIVPGHSYPQCPDDSR